MGDTCEVDEAPPPPPPIHTSYDLWNPGGDPGVLRAAAEAWRALAGSLRDGAASIDAGVDQVGRSWTGAAHDAFSAWWDQRHASLRDAAADCDRIADQVAHVADEIERINHQIHQLYLAVAATAVVAIAAAVITFGLSTAAEAAAATAAVAEAESLISTLSAVLQAARVAVTGARFVAFLEAWGTSAAVATAGAGVAKGVHGQNPFDLDNWSVRDLAGILISADAGGVAGVGFAGRPVLAGGAGSGGAALGNDLLDGKDPFTFEVLGDVALGAGTGAGGAWLGGNLAGRIHDGPPTLGPPATPPLTVVRGSGTARSIDDLWLPGRPPPAAPAPVAPEGPVLWLPGESGPRPIVPGASHQGARQATRIAGAVAGEAVPPSVQWAPPPPVLTGAGC